MNEFMRKLREGRRFYMYVFFVHDSVTELEFSCCPLNGVRLVKAAAVNTGVF